MLSPTKPNADSWQHSNLPVWQLVLSFDSCYSKYPGICMHSLPPIRPVDIYFFPKKPSWICQYQSLYNININSSNRKLKKKKHTKHVLWVSMSTEKKKKKSVCVCVLSCVQQEKKKFWTINWQDRFGLLIELEIAFQVSPQCDTILLGWSNSYRMAPHSSTLAWKIPWKEEPGRLQSLESLRHEWATSLSLFTFMHWRRKWQPTPVFLPGESQGRGTWWTAVYGVA